MLHIDNQKHTEDDKEDAANNKFIKLKLKIMQIESEEHKETSAEEYHEDS